ncbi:Down syndrome cell adhesion molecule [Mytilus galloprovincialis]|uniref:Down syndrome cell adhesion molecule n=1 Tax=Mytilus galloprovincialis TaxID=29158 RepID=A0A8B6HN27_MYTGA|nr:Down syndrome cell adhesion molecule [Mytilus galloprovincialis]
MHNYRQPQQILAKFVRTWNYQVYHEPDVTVANKTFSQSQTPRQIQSTLDSNPQVNICKWHHRSKYGEYIRDFSDNNQVLTLPTVPEDQRYQDTGEYVCTAENGIVGMNGQLQQTGSGYVISNASPVITIDNNSTQYGKFGKSTELKVNVYSIPKYSRISWYLGNTQLVSNKYAIKEEPAMVKDVFHGVEVELDGAPETPSNFNITSSSETSITVQWTPGYDGGQKQTFYVQYRTSGTNTWMIQKITTINQLDIHNFYTLSGLQEKTTYEIRMYAQNAFNQSPKTDTAFTTNLQSVFKEAQTSSYAITGAAAGVVVVLLTVCAIIISILMFKKRKGMTQTKK